MAGSLSLKFGRTILLGSRHPSSLLPHPPPGPEKPTTGPSIWMRSEWKGRLSWDPHLLKSGLHCKSSGRNSGVWGRRDPGGSALHGHSLNLLGRVVRVVCCFVIFLRVGAIIHCRSEDGVTLLGKWKDLCWVSRKPLLSICSSASEPAETRGRAGY